MTDSKSCNDKTIEQRETNVVSEKSIKKKETILRIHIQKNTKIVVG